MKKILTISGILFVFLLFSAKTQAQNLEFNRALSLSAPNATTTYTVPTGKVWKVTYLAAVAGRSGAYQYSEIRIYIDGMTVLSFRHSGNSSSQTNPYPCSSVEENTKECILWLPEGTTFTFYFNGNSACMNAYISGVEFNVNP